METVNYELSESLKAEILESYSFQWANAMLNQDVVNLVMSFMERHKDLSVSYQQVFFTGMPNGKLNGFNLHEKDGEQYLFTAKPFAGSIHPVTGNWDGDRNFVQWLKGSKIIKEYR